MSRYKPGSRINTVYTGFEAGGRESAEAAATGLGLAGTTVNSWIRTWEREKAAGGPPPARERAPKAPRSGPSGAPKAAPRPSRRARKAPAGARRIRTTFGKKRRTGSVVEAGPYVSEVEWDDGDQTNERYIPNDYIEDLPEDEPERKKAS